MFLGYMNSPDADRSLSLAEASCYACRNHNTITSRLACNVFIQEKLNYHKLLSCNKCFKLQTKVTKNIALFRPLVLLFALQPCSHLATLARSSSGVFSFHAHSHTNPIADSFAFLEFAHREPFLELWLQDLRSLCTGLG